MNLAVTLASKFQLKVGLLDADVYGPNIPIMMNIDTKPEVTQGISFNISLQCTGTDTNMDTALTCSHC